MKEEYREENTTSSRIEGRHSVLEALRAGSLIERLFVQKGCQDGPVLTILREAKKADVMVDFVPKERLDFMSETKNHQGVVAVLSAFAYSTIDDMFALAEKKGETPFFFILDGIEDPHNLGAIIRTAQLKEKGMWFVCADMDGELMYRQNLTGPIGLVIGNEGKGVSRLVKEHCDFISSIPMKGDIDSLNASVAAGVLAYEIVRQRMNH